MFVYATIDNISIYVNIDIVKATKIFSQKAVFKATSKGEEFRVSIIKEIFQIPEANAHHFPEGFKVSMIAYRNDLPEKRVLLDCHPPKGPHYHVGRVEETFEWKGLDYADELFWKLVETEFGKLEEVFE